MLFEHDFPDNSLDVMGEIYPVLVFDQALPLSGSIPGNSLLNLPEPLYFFLNKVGVNKLSSIVVKISCLIHTNHFHTAWQSTDVLSLCLFFLSIMV